MGNIETLLKYGTLAIVSVPIAAAYYATGTIGLEVLEMAESNLKSKDYILGGLEALSGVGLIGMTASGLVFASSVYISIIRKSSLF